MQQLIQQLRSRDLTGSYDASFKSLALLLCAATTSIWGSRPARCTPRSVPDTCLGSRRPDWSIDMENVIPPFEITAVCTEEATGSYLCFPNIRKKAKNGTTNRYSFCCIRTKCDCSTTRFSFDAICLCANRPKVDGAMWSEQPRSKFAGVVRIEDDGDCNLNFVPRKQANFDQRRRHEHRQNLYTASYNICVRTTTSTEEWRRDTIYWFNTNIVKSAAKSSDVKVDSFMSERKNKSNSNIRLCTGCKRFISGRNFWRHKCCDDKPV